MAATEFNEKATPFVIDKQAQAHPKFTRALERKYPTAGTWKPLKGDNHFTLRQKAKTQGYMSCCDQLNPTKRQRRKAAKAKAKVAAAAAAAAAAKKKNEVDNNEKGTTAATKEVVKAEEYKPYEDDSRGKILVLGTMKSGGLFGKDTITLACASDPKKSMADISRTRKGWRDIFSSQGKVYEITMVQTGRKLEFRPSPAVCTPDFGHGYTNVWSCKKGFSYELVDIQSGDVVGLYMVSEKPEDGRAMHFARHTHECAEGASKHAVSAILEACCRQLSLKTTKKGLK